MTFRDLKKRISLEVIQQQQSSLFERPQNKPFWIWDKQQHKQEDINTDGDCCFNHIIGLPQKDGDDKPLFEYEQIIYDSLVGNAASKHLWIKKATGLGVSEFMLRFMAWLCLKDNALAGSQMCIVTGPRIELAIALIDRMKKLFANSKGIAVAAAFDTKETIIELNGVKIEAFPSHHLDVMRGLPNVSFILLDEADFFAPGQQQDARDVSERCIAKSNPYIVMVSTPNAPEGLFERIEKESEDTCLYKRIFLDYTSCLSLLLLECLLCGRHYLSFLDTWDCIFAQMKVIAWLFLFLLVCISYQCRKCNLGI
ncbi:MAG TPA: DEAD/DEAH box helicase family protein, partial [Nitrososphaeraceae archaeon]|nr:DEAD/DEAH box helicase family protein [Nitrososphaeraceae archaeon]